MRILSLRLKTVIITLLVMAFVAIGTFLMAHTLSDAVSGQARLIPIYNVDTQENKVAITFNCAASGDIDNILGTLENHGIKCTFFLLGSWSDNYPDEVQKIYDAGHEIGNHGYSHKDLPTMNYEKIMLDIQKCNETVRNITGHSPVLFRAPSGAYDNKTISAAEDLGMTTIQWDVDSIDWKNISASEIVERVTTRVKNGSIIQLHTGTKYTAEALPLILDFLETNNFQCVTVSELIYHDDYFIDNNGMQIRESHT